MTVLKLTDQEYDQQSRDRALGEAYTVRIKLGFLITAVVSLISVIAIFISLRADVLSLLKTVSQQQEIITQVQAINTDLRIQIQSINDSLAYLKATIEVDRREYFRERNR